MIPLILVPLFVALGSPATAQPSRSYLDVNYINVNSHQDGRTDVLTPQRIGEIFRSFLQGVDRARLRRSELLQNQRGE